MALSHLLGPVTSKSRHIVLTMAGKPQSFIISSCHDVRSLGDALGAASRTQEADALRFQLFVLPVMPLSLFRKMAAV